MVGPYYDSEKDEIVGAKPGTITYMHEEGHRKLEKEGKAKSYDNVVSIAAILTVFCVSWQLWFPAQVFSLIMMLYYIIPEIHAWIYAFEAFKKRRDDKSLEKAGKKL